MKILFNHYDTESIVGAGPTNVYIDTLRAYQFLISGSKLFFEYVFLSLGEGTNTFALSFAGNTIFSDSSDVAFQPGILKGTITLTPAGLQCAGQFILNETVKGFYVDGIHYDPRQDNIVKIILTSSVSTDDIVVKNGAVYLQNAE